MDEIDETWNDDDDTYTDENGIPFWVIERQEDELRAWDIVRDMEDR